MDTAKLHYTASVDAGQIKERLGDFLVEGTLSDQELERRLLQLDKRFSVYTSTYPYGLWAPGLAVSPEMGRMTEIYLPMSEIRQAFNRLFTLAFRFAPDVTPSPLDFSPDWLTSLSAISPPFRHANPAEVIRTLTSDEAARLRVIFSMFLPSHHGGRFDRYPGQSHFLRSWIRENLTYGGDICCLDAACGTGEGTFALALLLKEAGIALDRVSVHGSSVGAVEVFAAAHGYFPHDASKQEAFRHQIGPLVESGAMSHIGFFCEDICSVNPEATGSYDIILCNGLLGGPTLHNENRLRKAVSVLAARLRPGGVLLAANRFHDGWKKTVPAKLLEGIFAESGLLPLSVEEGVGGQYGRRA